MENTEYVTAFVQPMHGEFNSVKVNRKFYYNTLRTKLNIKEGDCVSIRNGNIEIYLRLEIDDSVFDEHVGLSYFNYDRLGKLLTGLIELRPAPKEKCTEIVKPTKTKTEKIDIEKSFEWDLIPDTTFDYIKGLDYIKDNFKKLVFYLNNPEWLLLYEIIPQRAFLLFGPPGCGKTMLAKAIANTLCMNHKNIRFKIILSTQIKSKYLGESAKAIQTYFEIARKNVEMGNTVIYFFDEIDSIVPSRSAEDTHKEYVDVVNIFLQELEGARELPTYTKLRELFKDDEVITIREKVFNLARNHGGEIPMNSSKIQKYLQILRDIIHEKIGSFSTFIIIGATNNPYHIHSYFRNIVTYT
jgi:SpoVK/Ycf46/Vps4 family AAA+-type ATPase